MRSEEALSVLSKKVFVVKQMDCPFFWELKLQSYVSLSTTEAKSIVLSHYLGDTMLPL